MRRALVVTALASFASLAACASPPPPVTPTPAPVAPEPLPEAPVASTTSAAVEQVPAPREDGRLPGGAVPRRYALTLNVDPTQERFQGQVTITIDLPRATSHVVLHGRNLTILDVTATVGSAAHAGAPVARVSHGGVAPEEIVLSFAEPLPAGRAALSIRYDAPFDRELSGLYRVKEGERWYAFTQFESTSARRAFPCFDEPANKVPFDLEITTPKGMIAVANSPELSRADADAKTHFDFASTPPLPTYLLAFAVGDFDVRAGATTPVPIRLITVKGKAHLGDGALDATAGLVKKLGEYFALPYPFAKLDIVAVPDFAAGAMENPGLVTFREEALLFDASHTSVSTKREIAVTIAHELSHIWFGDLVTMKWWNDVWLNEGFATWMETKATDAWHPDYAARLDAVASAQHAMNTDALASARAVRQPVATTGEIEEAFDGISYSKGAAVLGMIEHWIGPDVMQKAVRDYIQAHAWKNAEAADLMGALDRASGRDVSGMAATFLDRPGVPDVAVTSSCTDGKLTLGFTQSAWHPLGVAAKATDAAPWRIPVCVHTGRADGDECTVLGPTTAGASTVLDVGGCPAWTLPNAAQAGYYRVSLPEKDLRALARNEAQLDVPDRIALLSNLWAQVRAGEMTPEAALDVLPAFDRETESHVVGVLVSTLGAIDHALVGDTARYPFRGYVAMRLARAKQALGWEAKDGEGDDVALTRSLVLKAMGELGRDPATLHEANGVAASWLKDPSSVDAEVASIAVPLASIRATPARLDQLRAAAKSAKTPLDKIIALTAMGSFDDKTTLERAWALALTDEIRQQDIFYVLNPALHRASSARALFAWVQANWDALRARMSTGYQSSIVDVVRSACTKEDLDAELAYFGPRVKELEGVARPLAENAESATACIALRAHGGDAVTQYFKKDGKGAAK